MVIHLILFPAKKNLFRRLTKAVFGTSVNCSSSSMIFIPPNTKEMFSITQPGALPSFLFHSPCSLFRPQVKYHFL